MHVNSGQLVYGSVAIKHWFPDYSRTPKDLDIISIHPNKNINNTEYYWTDAFEYILIHNKDNIYTDPDFLYTIKVSHLSWDINWDKHMRDAIFLSNKQCKLNKELYNSLYSNWIKLHGPKQVNLNVKNSEFFNENITRKYNHDELHQLLSFYERPLHEYIRPNADSPLCSEELWDCLTDENKVKCALEEIYVIATERYIIPKSIPVQHAKYLALKQLITSMTTGWFNVYLIEHFDKLLFSGNNHLNNKLKQII